MYTQLHIHRSQRNEDTDGKGVQEYEQGYAYINNTVTQVSIRFVKQEKEKEKGGGEYRTEHKTHI